MYKKIVKNVLLAIIVFFGFNFYVNASSIYDYLKSGDIIIGNTTFRNGTWISATRASKAGSLYTMVNGDIDVKTYKYINQNVWYEMDPDTDKYKILSKEEISDLNKSLYINFLNNEPITKTYKAKIVEEDEFSGGPNAVHDFFNYLEGDKFVDESEVILDYQNQTITCEFNTIFEFSVVKNDVADYYTGFCNSEFYYLPQDEGLDDPEPVNPRLNIISSKLAIGEEFLNQDKVTLIDRNETTEDGVQIYYPANHIEFTINEKFDKFSYDEYSEEGKYLVFDFEIDESGDAYNIRDIISYEDNYDYQILDEHNFRLFVEIDDRYEGWPEYILLNYAGNYTTISLSYEGLELPDTDFELLDIKPANIDVEGNNQALIDDIKYEEDIYTDDEGYVYKDKFYNVYTIGNLNYFGDEFNTGHWLAFELEFDAGVYLDEIAIYGNDNLRYYYEIVEDKILLWIDAYDYQERSFISFDYSYTNGNTSDRIELKVYNFYEDMSINYDKEILGFYEANLYENEDIISKLEPISNYNEDSDIYYSANEQKLYFKDGASQIYKDEESYKMFVVDYDAIWNRELVGILCKVYPPEEGKDTGGVSVFYGLANSDYESFEWFDDYIDDQDGVRYVLYYFFNREKTESELETISNLEDLGVDLVDLSTYYYGKVVQE